MAFFKGKWKGIFKRKVKVADVYVVTSMIISNYNDGIGNGPICVTMYFLAKCKKGQYYELFSGKKLEKETQHEGLQFLNTPYVKKVEPLTKYLKNYNKAKIDIQSLFDLITRMNVLGMLGAFSDESTQEE